MNSNELKLLEPWATYLKDGRFSEYIDALCDQGLPWWHEMLVPQIAIHLAPLTHFPPNLNHPIRLVFLMETLKPGISSEIIEELYQKFTLEGDHEGAVAAICAEAIFNTSNPINFVRFDLLEEKIKRYLDNPDIPLSHHARASLLSFKGQIEFYRYGLLQQPLDTWHDLMKLADIYSLTSFKLISAAWQIYPLVYMMRFSDLNAMLMSIYPLTKRSDISFVIQSNLRLSISLAQVIEGKPEEAELILRDMVNQPFFSMLPVLFQIHVFGHLMLSFAAQQRIEEVLQMADKIFAMAVPMEDYMHISYAHYCAGLAYLLIGDPTKALAHASECMQREEALRSPITENTGMLLLAQANIDAGNKDNGISILTEQIEKWRDTDFILLATTGYLELAMLYAERGELEKARKYYRFGMSLFPKGERHFVFFRHTDFIPNLEKFLFLKGNKGCLWAEQDDAAVKIKALGGLSIKIGNQIIYDREWRGRSTKTLLKLLMTLGGKKVSFETLCDIMWPDSEGDIAEQNLKVAIHRLKKVGIFAEKKELPWLVVKHKTVSLSGFLCHVDALYFESEMEHALKNGVEMTRLMYLLNIYDGDYLPKDDNDSLIVKKREALRTLFIKGVKHLYTVASTEHKEDAVLPYLEKSINIDPVQEDLYESLITIHLSMGYPSKAIQTYKKAEKELAERLDIEPCIALRNLYAKTKNHLQE